MNMNVEKRFKKENLSKVTPNVSYENIAPYVYPEKSVRKKIWPKIFIPSAAVFTLGIIAVAVLMSGMNVKIVPALMDRETISSQSAPVVINAIRTSTSAINNGSFLAPRLSAFDYTKNVEDISEENPAFIEEDDPLKAVIIELDAILTNNDTYVINDLVSDREDYPYLQEVHYTDVDGSSASYNLYYHDPVVEKDEKMMSSNAVTTYSGIAQSGELQFDFDVIIQKEIKMRKEQITSLFTLHESENVYTTVEVDETAKRNKQEIVYVCTKVDNGVETKYSLAFGTKKNGNKYLVLSYDDFNYEVSYRIANGTTFIDIVANDEEKMTYIKTVDEDGNVDYVLSFRSRASGSSNQHQHQHQNLKDEKGQNQHASGNENSNGNKYANEKEYCNENECSNGNENSNGNKCSNGKG